MKRNNYYSWNIGRKLIIGVGVGERLWDVK